MNEDNDHEVDDDDDEDTVFFLKYRKFPWEHGAATGACKLDADTSFSPRLMSQKNLNFTNIN